jgi:hypothetical protein
LGNSFEPQKLIANGRPQNLQGLTRLAQEKRPVAETQNITPWEEDEGTEEVEEGCEGLCALKAKQLVTGERP